MWAVSSRWQWEQELLCRGRDSSVLTCLLLPLHLYRAAPTTQQLLAGAPPGALVSAFSAAAAAHAAAQPKLPRKGARNILVSESSLE